MPWSVLRVVLVLVVAIGLPHTLGVGAVRASGFGSWQVLGAARALPTLYRPAGLAVDAGGNVYVADSGNFRVVEIGADGRLLAHFGDADLRPRPGAALPPGQEAMGPRSLAVDAHGLVYVADAANGYIRVFSPQHHLTGDWPVSVPGATITQMSVAVAARGNVIVAIAVQPACAAPGSSNPCAMYYLVQRRSPTGAVLGQFHSAVGPPSQFTDPPIIRQIATAVDTRGDIYIAVDGVTACYKDCDSFHYLVKHRFDGKKLVQAGTEELDVGANWPALGIGGRGNVFVADDFNHRIDKRTPGTGFLARVSLAAVFPVLTSGPSGVAVDRHGWVYVSDEGSGRVLKLSSNGSPLAQWGAGGSAPGRFWFPGSVALDAAGRLWADDSVNGRVQVLGSNGGFHVAFRVPHAGPAMALGSNGTIVVGQLLGRVVCISTFSPSGRLLARWGRLHLAELPSGIAVAANGDVFVAGDFYFGGKAAQLTMNGENILRLDSHGRQLGLFHVTGGDTRGAIAVDGQENSYVAYGTTPRFEKWSRDGVLLASWGNPNPEFEMPSPAGITVDSTGALYVADTPQNIVEKFGAQGELLGTWGFHGSYAGQFHHPDGIAVDSKGSIYVADEDNHRIQVLPRH